MTRDYRIRQKTQWFQHRSRFLELNDLGTSFGEAAPRDPTAADHTLISTAARLRPSISGGQS